MSSKSGSFKEFTRNSAVMYVVLLGMVSLFADMTYESARSIMGPYLKLLGGSAMLVGFVAGLGELVGYAFRIFTGMLADRTGKYWFFTILGYTVNLLAVPLLALTGNWIMASVLLVMERFGKAIRNPSRDAMLAFARDRVGSGWTYGLHEAMDQVGAVTGPVIIAGVLYFNNNDYRSAFAVLFIPALVALALIALARFLYPNPQDLEVKKLDVRAKGMNRNFWLYILAVGLVAFGFVDFPLIAFHLQSKQIISEAMIPILYAAAMAVDAIAALIFGYLYDRIGFKTLIIAAVISSVFAPFAFNGGYAAAWAGVIIWGIGMGWQESVMRSVVSDMADPARRASAFGIFNAGYGIMWFLGSWSMGFIYDISEKQGGDSFTVLIAVSIAAQLSAVPFLAYLSKKIKKGL